MKTINAGVMAISPVWLNCVTAHNLETGEIKTVIGVTRIRPDDVAKHVRLAATGRAGTSAAKKLQIEIRLSSVIPLNGELVSDPLNIDRLQAHGGDDLITTSILRAIFVL